MGRAKIGNTKCRCGRVGAPRRDGRTLCAACWAAAGRHTRHADDDDEVAAAIEEMAIIGVSVALGDGLGAVAAAAPVVGDAFDTAVDTILDIFDW